VEKTTARLLPVVLALGIGIGIGVGAGAANAAQPIPTDAVYHRLCRSIQARHVRALFSEPAAPVKLGGSSDCTFYPRGGSQFVDGVQVYLRIDDGDETLWEHRGDRSYGRFRTLTGAGTRAKWGYQGGRLPSVVDARSGTFTCTIIPDAGGRRFAPIPGGQLAAARTFAGRLVALCADVFAAYR
jgi:hypothetical protein